MASDSDATNPISVSLTPTFPEYLRINWWVTWRRFRLLVPFAVLMLIGFAFIPMLVGGPETPADQYVRLAPALILPAIVFLLLPITIYLSVRRRWKTAPELREPRTYTINNDGLRVVGVSFEGFTAWSNIVSAERVGSQILLGNRQQQFFLIPDRAMESDELWLRFCQLVSTKVSGSRLKAGRRSRHR